MIMAYLSASLETNPTYLPRIRDKVLDQTLWAALKGHKNPYFAFLWGSTRLQPSPSDLSAAATQLAQFQPGPRVHAPRDNTANPAYLPHDANCTSEPMCDTTKLAVDVADRTIDDFLWQRQPWRLKDDGNPIEVFPGVDYLAAYWAGRRYGFVSDDRAGTCTRYAP
jgi:hypothetical protein